MGRRGRSNDFLRHWHRRALDLDDGRTLRWTFIDDPRSPAPHAEAFRITAPDGTSHGLHPDTARRLLAEHEHPDAAHVPAPPVGGAGWFH